VETDGGTGSRALSAATARQRRHRLAGCAGIGVLAIVASWISRLPSAAVLPITRLGQLPTITIGWVVMVTVANMTLDRYVYRVQFPVSKWLAAIGAVMLLVYLFAGRNDSSA
jgi:hypothetical protein